MTTVPTVATAPTDLKADLKAKPLTARRWFFAANGLITLALVLVGFKLFYFGGRSYPGRPIPEPIRALVITHGVVMMAWVLLFAAQPMLIALRRRRLHMALGRLGALIAAGVVVTGVWLAVASARTTPDEVLIWGMGPRPFLSVPLTSALIFGGFVGIAIWKRKRPAVHRAAMFLGTLAALSAAVSRIDPVNALYLGTVWERAFGPFFGALAIGGVLVAVRCVLARQVERWLVFGYLALVAMNLGIIAMARTPAWDAFAGWVIGG
jgi:hypothetical protein